MEKREPFTAGTLVGERYRIVAPLARGGFGVVYVAEQLVTARRVALKLLTSHVQDVTIERLLAEARIASHVSSEHIVQVYDAGIDPESSFVFVAMELLSGMNLAELVQGRGPCSTQETAEYLRQVALGLDKVHGVVANDGRAAPIVHRDLKPANLFLTQREDGTAWIKILDFGAAKMLSDTGQVSAVLRGTPEYMAYEQAAGAEVTPATDIWALGLIAFFLLTGRSYWRGAASESGRTQVFAEVLTLPLAPASERARELAVPVALSAAFDAWFARCVNRDAAARYASAGVAARELARALRVSAGPLPAPSLLPAATARDATPSPKGSSLTSRDITGVAASSRGARLKWPALSALVLALLIVAALGAFSAWVRSRPMDAPNGAAAASASAAAPAPALAQVPALPAAAPALPSAASPSPPAVAGSAAPLHSEKRRRAAAPPRGGASSSPASSSAPARALNEDVYELR